MSVSKEFKKFVEDGIVWAKKTGFKFKRDNFGDLTCGCPISAAAHSKYGVEKDRPRTDDIAADLNISMSEIWGFIDGVDGNNNQTDTSDPYYVYGQEIAKRLFP